MEHYFTNNPNLKSERREISYTYQDYKFSFWSDNGIFSKDKIDYASETLVNAFLDTYKNLDEFTKVLDIGCGYGYIGTVISKVLNVQMDFADINKRALHLCGENIKVNKINGRAIESDGYTNIKDTYDFIITNPPIRVGKCVLMSILKGAKEHLSPSGELWFVINKNQGAKSTKNALEECYNIEVIKKSKGFYVFRAKNR